jgi:hypothetical protein
VIRDAVTASLPLHDPGRIYPLHAYTHAHLMSGWEEICQKLDAHMLKLWIIEHMISVHTAVPGVDPLGDTPHHHQLQPPSTAAARCRALLLLPCLLLPYATVSIRRSCRFG